MSSSPHELHNSNRETVYIGDAATPSSSADKGRDAGNDDDDSLSFLVAMILLPLVICSHSWKMIRVSIPMRRHTMASLSALLASRIFD
jgi:hypothetical protein